MKLIALDLDGTLCNTLKDIADSLNLALEKAGYPTFSDREVNRMIGRSIAYMCQRAMPKGHENDWKPLMQIYYDEYDEHLCDNTYIYEGWLTTLDALKKRGYTLAVVTNKPHAHAVKIINTLFPGNGAVFARVQGQAAKFTLKPDPASLNFVMQELGATPADSIYVGDSEVDVQFANNSGLRFIGCNWGFRGAEALKKAGATECIDRPAQLLELV